MSIVAETQPSRQGYRSAAVLVAPGIAPRRAGEVQPAWLALAEVTGVLPVAGGGMWLNCVFEYRKPQGEPYRLEAAVKFDHRAQCLGVSFVRSCTCPDARHRAESGARGEARFCKHMEALRGRIALTVGDGPAVRVAREHFAPAAQSA